ncbi:hypothetical protein B2M20_17195 [Nitrobacter vulgaris]|uniref:Uncharacterized protein n=1 Tax=Nitrobacter vulgaris TaxID=29421 RepID=A0A1V4HUE9_NITVU|nr:hypothetical protein B2M20_17195 [Nitrobacter vulgaris]
MLRGREIVWHAFSRFSILLCVDFDLSMRKIKSVDPMHFASRSRGGCSRANLPGRFTWPA